jgi:hypothetical protein
LIGQALGKAVAPPNAPLKDELLLVRYREERKKQYTEIIQRHIQKQRDHDSEWRARYNAYLKTPEWHAVRKRILKRAGGVCEGCGEKVPTQVHHLSYAHVFHEFLFELVAVCDECHDRVHQDEQLLVESEWQDGFPCEACRWQDEKDNRRWCGRFDIYAVTALSAEGECGPALAGLEPLN